MILKNLSKRNYSPELMDDFQEGIEQLRIVFNDINRVNSVLGGNSITIKAITALIKENPQKLYTVIDMGCGDGNMLREIAKYYRKKNIAVRLIGVDLNEQALAIAREASREFIEIEYKLADILQIKSDDYHSDIVVSTLCMHHFMEKKTSWFF